MDEALRRRSRGAFAGSSPERRGGHRAHDVKTRMPDGRRSSSFIGRSRPDDGAASHVICDRLEQALRGRARLRCSSHVERRRGQADRLARLRPREAFLAILQSPSSSAG